MICFMFSAVYVYVKWDPLADNQPKKILGPDYMSWAGPVSRAASVCRDDFQPGVT